MAAEVWLLATVFLLLTRVVFLADAEEGLPSLLELRALPLAPCFFTMVDLEATILPVLTPRVEAELVLDLRLAFVGEMDFTFYLLAADCFLVSLMLSIVLFVRSCMVSECVLCGC